MLNRLLCAALTACAAFASFASKAESPEPAGVQACLEVRNVHDGDTFTCVTAAGPIRVRVAGVDAPEVGQGFWRVSRDLLRSSTRAGSKVDCYKVDRYERQVCRVLSPEGKDLALGLVEAGLAWHTVKYREEQTPAERSVYATAEQAAIEGRLGLWQQTAPQPPWDCRDAKKARQLCN